MERRNFGDTGVSVSAISLGCWIFGVDWWGHYTDDRALELLRYSLAKGITYFDNGDAYGNGRAEEILGKFVAEVGRDKIEIGGKFGYDFYSDPGEVGGHRERKQDFSPQFMQVALERSLKRLQTDHLDLYMAHNIKLPQFRDDMFQALDRLAQQGKIRAWGVSLGPAIGWREEGIKAIMDHGAQAVQTVYNLFEQAPGREFCETARACRAGVIARVHDNSGILKDAVTVDLKMAPSDHRKFRDNEWKIYGLKKLEFIRPLAAQVGLNLHEFACRWLLNDPSLTAITGTFLNEKEIDEACRAADAPALPRAMMQQLAQDYATNWGLGDIANPCDIKSSTDPSGKVRSRYVPPPTVLAGA